MLLHSNAATLHTSVSPKSSVPVAGQKSDRPGVGSERTPDLISGLSKPLGVRVLAGGGLEVLASQDLFGDGRSALAGSAGHLRFQDCS